MPSEEETRQLMANSSKRGQPIPQEVLDELKRIDVDTNGGAENNSGQQKETDVKQT
jgi:hypothetical protein